MTVVVYELNEISTTTRRLEIIVANAQARPNKDCVACLSVPTDHVPRIYIYLNFSLNPFNKLGLNSDSGEFCCNAYL